MTSSLGGSGDLCSYGQIVLFGDSITEQSFNPAFFGSGSALANDYARKLDVINRGFSGYTSREARHPLPRVFPTRNDDVKLVFVFFGANDAVLEGYDQHIPLIDYVENMKYILTSEPLRKKVIAVIPPPIEGHSHDVDFGPTRTAESTRLYGDALRKLCADSQIPIADVWSSFMQSLDWDGKEDTLPGTLRLQPHALLQSYFRDGLHPVGPGYKLIYSCLVQAIRLHFPKLDPEKAPYHTPYWQHAIKPKSGELIRWVFDTTQWTDEACQALLATLPSPDQRTVTQFHFQKDRNMALGSILLQRKFIREILGAPLVSDEPVTRDENRRPYYRSKSVRAHDFNVSHHAGTVVLAGAVDSGSVGIDITNEEQLNENETQAEFLANFKDCFSQAEWTQIAGNMARFAQHWALKEAYVKATGTGIVVDLPAIEFDQVKYVSQEKSSSYSAAQLSVTDDKGVKSKNDQFKFEIHWLKGQYIAVASERSSLSDVFTPVQLP